MQCEVTFTFPTTCYFSHKSTSIHDVSSLFMSRVIIITSFQIKTYQIHLSIYIKRYIIKVDR